MRGGLDEIPSYGVMRVVRVFLKESEVIRVTSVTTPQGWRVEGGTVPLADVAKTAQCSYMALDGAVRSGLIDVARQGGRGNARHIRLEDALLIVGVAALAIAAGMAFTSLLRAIKSTGAQVTPQGLTIPLDIAA